jgi:hypothetical protein
MVTKLVPTDPLKQLETPEVIVTGTEAAVAETLAEAPERRAWATAASSPKAHGRSRRQSGHRRRTIGSANRGAAGDRPGRRLDSDNGQGEPTLSVLRAVATLRGD